MKKILLIDCESYFTSVALLECGRIAEFYSEYADSRTLSGNIYKGKVTKIVSGLDSAFVDIGTDRPCFWEISDINDSRTRLMSSAALPRGQIIAKEGDYVMVQVTKEGTDVKGPKVSSNISIAGHYAVYLYNVEFIGVSNKITDSSARDRLTGLFTKLAPEGRGFIARTCSAEASDEEIAREAGILIGLGERLQKHWEDASDIMLVHSEGNILYRMVRDMLSSDIESIYCNDRTVANDIKGIVDIYFPFFGGEVHYFDEPDDIYQYFGVGDEIQHINDRKVKLDGGGSLVIEKTEALTAIDVNTGSFSGSDNHEETVFLNNLESVKEIARQIRVRNVGGIIVIDFVDMIDLSHREAIVDALRRELVNDRCKTKILDMSEFGLVQITRQKNGKDFQTISETECPFCRGLGQIYAPDYIARNIKTELKKLFANKSVNRAAIHVNPHNFNHLFDSGLFEKDCKVVWHDRPVYAIADWSLHVNDYYVVALQDWETVPEGSIKLT